jgi:hypothetical protein
MWFALGIVVGVVLVWVALRSLMRDLLHRFFGL